jgi:hypothetical protein
VGTTTIHYVPLLLMTTISTLILTMVGWKIGAITSNPAIFLQPSVDGAAGDIAIVCDGKLSSKTLTPPPPGASYMIMNCLERDAMMTTSTVFEIAAYAKMAYDLGSTGKEIKDKLQGGTDSVDEVGDMIKKMIAGDDMHIDADEIDDILDKINDVRKDVDDIGDAGTDIRRAFGDADLPDDVLAQQEDLARQLDRTEEGLDELENSLRDAQASGSDFDLDCTDASNAGLCQSFQTMDDALGASYDSLEGLYRSAKNYADKGSTWSRVKRSLGVNRAHNKLSEIRSSYSAIYRQTRSLPKTTAVLAAVNDVRSRTRRRRWHTWFPAVNQMLNRQENIDVNVQYLDDNDEFFDLLEGESVGVKYTPLMMGMVRTTGDDETDRELVNMSEKAFDVAGEFFALSARLNEELVRELRSNGYHETAGYVYNTEQDRLLLFGRVTNLDPSIFTYAASEYAGKVNDECDTEPCLEYVGRILETGVNMTTGDSTLEDLRREVESNNDVPEERENFLDLLDYLGGVDAEADYVMGNSTEIQKEVAAWVTENCETETLHYSDGQDVTIAECGMVLDCTPGDFCYIGFLVVNSDPWVPYIPISYLEDQDAAVIAELSGFNYDSAARVVTPGGLTGCGGFDFSDHKVYICAMLPDNHRCKLVDCGRPVDVVYESFQPSVVAEYVRGDPSTQDDDRVQIRGNFLKW